MEFAVKDADHALRVLLRLSGDAQSAEFFFNPPLAPSPEPASNNNELATTAWTRSCVTDAVQGGAVAGSWGPIVIPGQNITAENLTWLTDSHFRIGDLVFCRFAFTATVTTANTTTIVKASLPIPPANLFADVSNLTGAGALDSSANNIIAPVYVRAEVGTRRAEFIFTSPFTGERRVHGTFMYRP
jgi:hypothetical protein